MTDRLSYGAETLELAMPEIAKGDTRKAAEQVREQYPFVPPVEWQGIGILDRMRVFLWDGVIDRYGGVKLQLIGDLIGTPIRKNPHAGDNHDLLAICR